MITNFKKKGMYTMQGGAAAVWVLRKSRDREAAGPDELLDLALIHALVLLQAAAAAEAQEVEQIVRVLSMKVVPDLKMRVPADDSKRSPEDGRLALDLIREAGLGRQPIHLMTVQQDLAQVPRMIWIAQFMGAGLTLNVERG
jgi:hypothetical protein